VGYLWGYVEEEGLASGRGFSVLWLMERFTGPIPGAVRAYVAIAAVVVVSLAIAVAFRKDRSPQTSLACLSWLLVIFLVVLSPHYPWYFLVLVPMLVIHPSATAWVLTLGSPLLYDVVGGAYWPGYDLRVAVFTLATVAALVHDARSLRGRCDIETAGAIV